MKLSQRVNAGKTAAWEGRSSEQFERIKSRVHVTLVDRLDLEAVTRLSTDELSTLIRDLLTHIIQQEALPLNVKEKSRLVSELVHEIVGFGPLQPFLEDETIQDILVNGPDQVMVEREGLLFETQIRFRDNRHLMHVIDKIVSSVGRRVDEASPMVDARLPDGSRVNVIIPPLALDGPTLSIRKFGTTRLTSSDLIRKQSASPAMMTFIQAAIRTKHNILISGGTGAGKTTLLNILSGHIPENERIITIEDSAELHLNQNHVVRLESRPPNVEGKGQVLLSDLVKNSLRMRPDRIIIGETRGGEVIDMLQAMNTGHPGSMSTVHANTSKDALSRIEVMASMAEASFSEKALRILVSSAVDLIVHISRLADGSRRLTHISEIIGMDESGIQESSIFTFDPSGVDSQGRILGSFKGRNHIPRAARQIKLAGIDLDLDIFRDVTEVGP